METYTRLSIFNRVACICMFILLGGVASQAQDDAAIFSKLKSEYPNESVVQLSKKVKYKIFIDKDGQVKAEVRNYNKYIYLKNISAFDSDRSTYSSDWMQFVDFEANSYVLSDGKYKRIPVKTYKEVKEIDGDVFYDDSKRLVFSYPSVSEGSIVELNTVHRIEEPRLLNSVFMNGYIAINEFEFTVEADKDVELIFKKKNFDEGEISYTESQERKTNLYTWAGKNLKQLKTERYDPDIRYFAPHIIPMVKGYRHKDKEVMVLNHEKELYSWYYDFIKDIDKDIETTELQSVVDSVTANCTTELEKVEKLYYWVQNNIKYIAFEYGMGGFIPRRPDEVCKKRYGDCKDKTSILHSLLKLAGIKSYFTWIGTRDIPYTYNDVPTPITDNHMILTYINGEDYYFLDATSQYHYFGLPSSFIQGKEALIGKGKDDFEVKQVPPVRSADNYIGEEIELTLDGTRIKGTGYNKLTGYPKLDMQMSAIGRKDEKLKNTIQYFLEKGSNKFILKDFKLPEDLKNFDKEMKVDYTFELDDYAKSVAGKTYINLNLYRDWLRYKPEKDRTVPIYLRYASVYDHVFKLKIPEGYTVDYVPENASFEADNLKLDITYEVKDGYINYSQFVDADVLMIEPKDFETWSKFIRAMELAYKQTVVIKKIDE